MTRILLFWVKYLYCLYSHYPTQFNQTTTLLIPGHCVTNHIHLASVQITSVSLLEFTRVYKRKLHHGSSKEDIFGSSEGSLHFVCIKDESLFWVIELQQGTQGVLSHIHKHTISVPLLKFLLSDGGLSKSLWVDSVSTVLISWAASLGLTNVLEFLCYCTSRRGQGHVAGWGSKSMCMSALFVQQLAFQSFHCLLFSDWLVVRKHYASTHYSFINFVFIWLTA